jgi:hypothetical protein
MEHLARYLIVAGVVLIVVGGGVLLAARLGLPLGHLPGDIHVDWEGGQVYLPIATSVIVSVILTLVLNLVVRLLRK